MIDPVTQLSFSMVENPGVYALLIGSGISRAAEIPTGWEILLDLTRRVALAEGVTDEADWLAWYRKRFGTEPSYSALLDALSITASDRRSILHNYIEPLARALGLAGRWGDGNEYELVTDCLRTLANQPPMSGSVALLALRTYPAYLCFLTYALGLTKAGRFDALFRWFRTDVARPGREPQVAANSLFMSFWEDAEPDWWKKRRPEYERRKTAWADYLVDNVVPWSSDYGLNQQQALENYNMTELLGGFAALSDHDADVLNALTNFTWMPHGRLMWASTDRSATLRRLETPELQARLFAAGFSKGSQAHWNGVKKNIGFLSQRVGW